jgi:hypothetical protein
MTRISAGLACITLSVIFAANALGLVPDRTGAVIEGRKRLSEALAVHFALAAQEGDVAAIIVTTKEIQRRNADLEWAQVRKADGTVLVAVGRKPAGGTDPAPDKSTPDRMRIPIALKDKPWGLVELGFKGVESAGLLALLGGPVFLLAAFVTAACFIGTFSTCGLFSAMSIRMNRE